MLNTLNTRKNITDDQSLKEDDEGFERPVIETEQFIPQSNSNHKHLPKISNIFKRQSSQNYNKICLISFQRKSTLKIDKQYMPVCTERRLSKKRIQSSHLKQSSVIVNPLCLSLRKQSKQINQELPPPVLKTCRKQVGQDLSIRVQNNSNNKSKTTKSQPAIFQQQQPLNSTYSFLKKITKDQACTFLGHKFNYVLRDKLLNIQHESILYFPKMEENLQFSSSFQSGNFNYITKASDNEYNMYLRADTNTKGHQGWFFFSILNKKQSLKIKINICNIRRNFRMIHFGQGIFIKKGTIWTLERVVLTKIQNKLYQLSFQIDLPENGTVEISLIPPYTYSDLFNSIKQWQDSKNVRVQILTYSHVGLAIPLVTITKGGKVRRKSIEAKRNLFFLTARTHPSETGGSYIIDSFIRQFTKNDIYDEFLKHNILKIVPMVNPDGVIFGNFRTNYLGDDLNRSFNKTDELLYPEIVALKELGVQMKNEYGKRFMAVIDLHGHSGLPNSFVYGPQYSKTDPNYMDCRILPKIIDKLSKYFRYEMSSFRLQQYKFNTERGYFSKKLKLPSYTIETSYALYQPKTTAQQKHNNLNFPMKIEEWTQLGVELAQSIKLYSQSLAYIKHGLQSYHQTQNKTIDDTKMQRLQLSNFPLKDRRIQLFLDIKRQIICEINYFEEKLVNHRNFYHNQSQFQSDGQDSSQDFSVKQKQEIIQRIRSIQSKNERSAKMTPHGIKPTIMLPYVVPSSVIMSQNNKRELETLEMYSLNLQSRRYRPVNIAHQYTEYLLKNVKDSTFLHPIVTKFKSSHGKT